jgi:hypothetical protein
MFGRLLYRLAQNEQKSKILAGAKPVKLNKWIQRIRASESTRGKFSVSQIVNCVKRSTNSDGFSQRAVILDSRP